MITHRNYIHTQHVQNCESQCLPKNPVHSDQTFFLDVRPGRLPWRTVTQSTPVQHIMCSASFAPRPTLQEGRVWEITLLGAVQLECDGFWIQQTPLSDIQHDWSFTTPIFKISTIYLLPAISQTWTLIGWTDVLSLINTCGSIPTVKTLLGIVIFQTIPTFFISMFL